MNQVTFTIDATEDNAKAISSIITIMVGITATTANKPAMQTRGAAKPAKTDKPEAKEETNTVSMVDFKAAAKICKKEHGEEFALQVIESTGTKVGTTLGRTVSKVDADSYQAIMDLWVAGPVGEADDDVPLDMDDDLDDDLSDDAPEVNAEAVKTALRAYSKETGRQEARDVMSQFNCKSLADVDKLDNTELAGLIATLL